MNDRLPPVIASTARLSRTDHKADLLDHPAPAITPAQAGALAQEYYGISGTIRPLTAEKDANFQITLASGTAALLKITNAAEDQSVTDMQTAALMHLRRVDSSLPVPHICQTLSGQAAQQITGPDGQIHVMRLLTYLEGTVLSAAEAGAGLHRNIGAMQARMTRGLQSFFHPAGDHFLQWDIKQADSLRPMLPDVADATLRADLTRLLDHFDAEIAPRLPHLRAQIVHNDFNPHNLLIDGPVGTQVTGIIDFGDMVHTPIACDLAVACSYQIAEGPAPMAHIAEMLRGYHAVLPLEDAEIALLPDLMRLRHATTLSIGAWRARRYPENAAYILRNGQASLRGLDALQRLGTTRSVTALRRALDSPSEETIQ